MASESLTISAPHLLAEYARESDLKGFFEKRLAAPPDHAAILIRNGQVVDAYKGTHFSIGGIGAGLRRLIGGSSHISILLADLKPFSLQTSFMALSRDKVEIACVATLELQLDPDKPANILGLVNPAGFLTRDEVLDRFKPHLTDRVVEASVGRVDANEIRGEVGLQDKIQADIMSEVERIAADMGLLIRAVSLEWAVNAVEREEMQRAVLDRTQEHLDRDLVHLERTIQRQADGHRVHLEADVDLAKLESASEDELAHMVLNQEVRFLDARQGAERRQELEALAHEIESLRTERVARFENELAEAGQIVDVAKRSGDLRKIHREIERLDQNHLAEMKKLGAYTDLEIHERTQKLELELQKRGQDQGLDHIRKLADLEQTSEDRDSKRRESEKDGETRRERERIQAETDARIAQLNAGSKMTPEQILAINAGLSSDVAAVLAEQARSQATGNEQVMSAMRDMVSAATDARVSSEEQAREMFRMGMEGAVGVAHGAGGKEAPAGGTGSSRPVTSECPSCGRENDSKAKFCVGCGTKLRV